MSVANVFCSDSSQPPAQLRALSPLNALSDGHLAHLLDNSVTAQFQRNQSLFRRGDTRNERVFILSGAVRLEWASGHKELLEAGDLRGAIVDELPRPCDCFAEQRCTALFVDAEALDCALSWSQMVEFLLTDTGDALGDDTGWAQTVLNSNLFHKVPPVNAQEVMPPLRPVSFGAGEVILREGDRGDACYFLRSGSARVTRSDGQGGSIHLSDIGPGRCFGEDALVYDTHRNATVTALEPVQALRLERADFHLLLRAPRVDELTEQEWHNSAETPVFIDVRTPAEYAAGHLVLSANLPLAELRRHEHQLSPSVPYVFYCDTGRRSRAAAHLLGKLGYNSFALRDGLFGSGMQYQLIQDCDYRLREGRIDLA